LRMGLLWDIQLPKWQRIGLIAIFATGFLWVPNLSLILQLFSPS
jgi:hypothetical protein